MATANLTFPDPVSPTPRNLPDRSAEHPRPIRCGSRLMPTVMLCSLGTAAYADLPLTLEEVIAKKDEVTVELGFDYGNFYSSDFTAEVNQDALSMSLGMRYGLTPATEIYGSFRGIAHQTRSTVPRGGDRGHASDVQWDSLTVGLNHRFSPDNKTPALLGYLQTEALENPSPARNDRLIHFKTWSVGLNTYRRIDPVVFSLSSGFRYNHGRDTEVPEAVTPGNSFYISPKLNLALNAETSVFGGAQWVYKVGKRVDGETEDINATQTSLLFGAAYAATKRATLHFGLSADISGRGGGNLSTLLRYTF